MSAGDVRLTADGEKAWRRLKQHLAWCDHFALGFIFSADPRIVSIFRERLAAIYGAHVTRLHMRTLETPERVVDELLPALLAPPEHLRALGAPYWIDLTRGADDEAWGRARLSFLARLNEQRERLRASWDRPLVLILPAAERERVKSLVPDLWAIRDFTVDAGPWVAEAADEAPDAPAPVDAAPAPIALDESDQARVAEWQRLADTSARSRGALAAGERAFDAYFAKGHWEQAEHVAEWLTRLARDRVAWQGETPQALRDLSVALNKVGDLAHARDDLEAAEQAFDESLAISHRLLEG